MLKKIVMSLFLLPNLTFSMEQKSVNELSNSALSELFVDEHGLELAPINSEEQASLEMPIDIVLDAIKNLDSLKLRDFLDKNPSLVHATTHTGLTALHIAAAKNLVATVLVLTDPIYKANINQQDESGWTALHYAIWKKSFSVIPILIVRNASLTIKNKLNLSPIELAQLNGTYSFIERFLTQLSQANILEYSSSTVSTITDTDSSSS